MKLFPNCSGDCCVCSLADMNCLAGIGDDYYSPATKEQVIERLDNKKYCSSERYTEIMIKYLKDRFAYEYKDVKYLIKSKFKKGQLLKYENRVIIFDNEEDANNFIIRVYEAFGGDELLVTPIDKDIIFALDDFAVVEYNEIKEYF